MIMGILLYIISVALAYFATSSVLKISEVQADWIKVILIFVPLINIFIAALTFFIYLSIKNEGKRKFPDKFFRL